MLRVSLLLSCSPARHLGAADACHVCGAVWGLCISTGTAHMRVPCAMKGGAGQTEGASPAHWVVGSSSRVSGQILKALLSLHVACAAACSAAASYGAVPDAACSVHHTC